MTDFPLLDANYAAANAEVGREVVADLGVIEPRIDETDSWITLPMRLVYDQAGGLHIELGPYAIDQRDIAKLREAIRQYDLANQGGPGLRRVQ
ncbi:hypothetical protein [Mycolicibacterium sphagni]|uniref:Uncharacterized protein n=1 Tax=Mycolicibacterium sphagni TaxID=1786 RepID=A0ABX2JP77_9MYCO|nr:hypothetical protein [Mycolicibacterium sphagni]NTY58677.1 hypothetical protein [Mycolicibacterium sphagni]